MGPLPYHQEPPRVRGSRVEPLSTHSHTLPPLEHLAVTLCHSYLLQQLLWKISLRIVNTYKGSIKEFVRALLQQSQEHSVLVL